MTEAAAISVIDRSARMNALTAASEFEAATPAEREATRQRVSSVFKPAGAHLVIDTVADLLPALALIEQRLAAGERP